MMVRRRRPLGKRVVLVKPGEILLIGNAGEADPEALEALSALWEELGIRVVVFVGDIDMDAVAGGSG